LRGIVNRSLVAFNIVVDSLEAGGKHLLSTGTSASASVLGVKYGSEAEQLGRQLGQSATNVALVYIDARGVSRKALLKSVGKTAVRGRMKDGRIFELTPDEVPVSQVQENDKGESSKDKKRA